MAALALQAICSQHSWQYSLLTFVKALSWLKSMLCKTQMRTFGFLR